MSYIFTVVNDFWLKFGFDGFILDILVSLVISLSVILFVVILGRVMDIFEYQIIRILSRIVGVKASLFICNRLTFPGIFVHEMSHAFIIWLTGGKIRKIRLFEFSRDGRLGHVEFETRGSTHRQMCQLALGSSAPVFMGCFVIKWLYVLAALYVTSGFWHYFIFYVIVSVFLHMSMSKEDLRNYFYGVFIIFFVVFVVCLAFQYFVVRT